jgi:hypothetical protein
MLNVPPSKLLGATPQVPLVSFPSLDQVAFNK